MKHPLQLMLAIANMPVACLAASPYAGDQSRTIKSLSQQEVTDYLSGKGMGFAKAAELNGYPGPAHVLELPEKLQLSPAQSARTEQIFGRMQARVRELGAKLVEAERNLDHSFAEKTISPESLATSVDWIGKVQSEIRAAHLQARLEQSEILAAVQTAKYWHLRGYANPDSTHLDGTLAADCPVPPFAP